MLIVLVIQVWVELMFDLIVSGDHFVLFSLRKIPVFTIREVLNDKKMCVSRHKLFFNTLCVSSFHYTGEEPSYNT